jgi:hypothetical protein
MQGSGERAMTKLLGRHPDPDAASQRLWNVGAKHADVLPECQWYRLQW